MAKKLSNAHVNIDIGAADGDAHYAGCLVCTATAQTAANTDVTRVRRPGLFLGAAKAEPWTQKEIYDKLKTANLGSIIAAEFKQLCIDGINVDPSV